MSVHYKFKNTINYDAVKFDGVYISASDLKSIISQQKKLGHSELEVVNEETKQVYSDDQMIPKNTNVIVSRIPAPGSNKRSRPMAGPHSNNNHNTNHHNDHHHRRHNPSLQGNSSASGINSLSSLGGNREALELVSTKNMTEEEKIKHVQSQSTRDFDPALYARGGRGGGFRGRGRGGGGGFLRNHVCRKCGVPGHHINDCKFNAMSKVKRSSGIPRDFLMKVDSKEKGALMTPSGEYAVHFIDREAYSKPKVEKAPFFEDGMQDSDDETKPDVKPRIECLTAELANRNEEQGTNKRQLELVPGESDIDREAKKAKLGFSVPNWKNISKSSQPDADRYAQYHMVQLRSTCESLVSARERRLLSMPMYTISCNVLCRHTKNGKDIYIPIEIGIHAYSIERGHLGKPYHCIIDSGPVPVGTVNLTRDHAEATHKISNPSKGKYPLDARNDYINIYKEMLKYTKGGERTVLVPDERDMDQVKGCLEWLYEKASFVDPDLAKISTWTILPMVDYVTAAYNFVHQRMLHNPEPIFTMHYVIKMKQEDSTWDYYEDYMCAYHRREENQTKWCAKSCATRAVLVIEQILNSLYDIYMKATGGGGGSQMKHPSSSGSMMGR